MNQPREKIHSADIPIRWGDLDAYGHVNNTVFFRYMEQVRVEWLERLSGKLQAQGDGPVIINASCTFLLQLNYPGTVTVEMYAEAPGRSSFMTHYVLRMKGVTYAEGASKVVWMNFSSGKSVPVPDAVRGLLPKAVETEK